MQRNRYKLETSHFQVDTKWAVLWFTLARERRIRRAEVNSFAANLALSDIVFLDEAEQMGRLTWWQFSRACRHVGGLIITTHRPGRLPTLIVCSTSPELVQSLVAELLGEQAAAWQETVYALYRVHKGNARDMLWAMYDLLKEKATLGT